MFAWILLLSVILYFVWKYIPRYLTLTPESYGKYHWRNVSWLVPHIAAGLFALLIGPLQFWPRMRRDYLQVHRIAGRLYVLAIIVGSLSSFGLASTITGRPAYAMGLAALGVAWLVTTGMAFVAIRKKNIVQHRQWMVRSYVVTFAFITFRLAKDLLASTTFGSLPYSERGTILAWGCWAIPLLLTEVILQARALFTSNRSNRSVV